jgi:hypothetical protein
MVHSTNNVSKVIELERISIKKHTKWLLVVVVGRRVDVR